MRKKIAWVALLLLLLVPARAWALARVADEADLLTYEEEIALDEKIAAIAADYAFDVALVTVDSLDGQSAEAYADDYYDYGGYGYGDARDGVLMLVAMDERAYHLSTTGYGITAFTDYGIKRVNERFQERLSDGEYYAAFDGFLDDARTVLEGAAEGEPYDVDNPIRFQTPIEFANEFLPVTLGGALVIALIAVFCMRGAMKSRRLQPEARDYVTDGSFELYDSRDFYVRSIVTRRKVESESSGGSSTHTGSSGTSHGGGGGHF